MKLYISKETVYSLLNLYIEFINKYEEKYPPDGTGIFRPNFEGMQEYYKLKQPVRDFLESLSRQEIIQIEALMYAGRDYELYKLSDRFITFDEHFEDFKNEDKDISINTILSKPLHQYLPAGLRYYKDVI